MGLFLQQTQAENRGNARFSYKKYYPIRKLIFHSFAEKFNSDMLIQDVANMMMFGDTQPAIVSSVLPLTVIAYSDEMDAVVRLRFPDELAAQYDLKVGTRLVTSCVYAPNTYDNMAKDVFVGERYTGNYSDFIPIVQLFLAKKDDEIRSRTALFSEEVWARVEALGKAYVEQHPNLMRDGFAYFKK